MGGYPIHPSFRVRSMVVQADYLPTSTVASDIVLSQTMIQNISLENVHKKRLSGGGPARATCTFFLPSIPEQQESLAHRLVFTDAGCGGPGAYLIQFSEISSDTAPCHE